MDFTKLKKFFPIKIIPNASDPAVQRTIENWLAGIAFVVAFIGVGYLLISFHDKNQNIPVLAAARDLDKFATLTNEDTKQILIPRAKTPDTAFVEARDVTGRVLAHKISANEILTINDIFQEGLDPKSDAAILPAGLKAFVLQSGWLSTPLPRIRKNDFISILMTVPARPRVEEGTSVLIDTVPVMGIYDSGEQTPQKILLALSLEQVAALVQARSNNLILTAVLHAHDDILNSR